MEKIYEKLNKYINKLNKDDLSNNSKYEIIDKIDSLRKTFKKNKNLYNNNNDQFDFIVNFFKNYNNYKSEILKREDEYINLEKDKNIEKNLVFMQPKKNENLEIIKKNTLEIKNITQNINLINNEIGEKLDELEKNYEKIDDNIDNSKKQLIDAYKINTQNRINKIKTLVTGSGAFLGGLVTLGNPIGVAGGSALGYKLGSFFGKKIRKKSEQNLEYL